MEEVRITRRRLLGAAAGASVVALAGEQAVRAAEQKAGKGKMEKLLAYVGTYTGNGKSKGIYRFQFDLKTGTATEPVLAAETASPSFLAIHPNHKYLYAVGEIADFGGKMSGAVSAFAIDPKTGDLTLLNQQASRGTGPCHLVVDHAGKNVLVANYGGGSVACLPIGADGHLGEATGFHQHVGTSVNPERQEGPHAHSINVDKANKYVFAADLGLDQVLIYRLDAEKGTLTPNDPPFAETPKGAGPRHFAFRPDGKFAYVINELNSTVTAFRYDPSHGTLTPVQNISTLPEGYAEPNYPAEVVAHPSGKFLYGSNRGQDSIAMFRIDEKTGELTSLGQELTGGKNPRNFVVDPTGAYLLAENQDSDSVLVFRVDPETGKLQKTGVTIAAPMPVCIRFLPL